MANNEFIIDTELNNDGAIQGAQELIDKLKVMAQTTGGVGKATKAAFRQANSEFSKANNAYDRQKAKVEALQNELDNTNSAKVTAEYKKIEKELDALIEKQMKAAESLSYDPVINGHGGASKAKETVDQLEAEINAKRAQLEATPKYDESATDKIIGKLVREEDLLDNLAFKQREAGNAAVEAARMAEAEANKGEGIISRLKARISGLGNSFKKLGLKMSEAFKSMRSHTEKTGKSLKLGFKNLLKYSLGIRSVYILVNKLRTALVDGFKNLAQYSSETNKSISMVWSALEQLKNSLAAAFDPILTAVAPILTYFINLLTQVATAIGMVIARLSGASTFKRATKVQKDYAASLKETSDAAKGLLSPLDDINKAEDNKSGGGAGGTSPSDMFEEVPIEPWTNKWADILGNIWDVFKKAWENKGKAVIDAWHNALNGIKYLIESIAKSFYTVWTNGSGELMLNHILQILANVLNIVGNLATAFADAWNECNVGTSIVQHIFDIINSILGVLSRVTYTTAEWAKTLDFYPLLSGINDVLLAMQPVVDKLGQVFEYLWNNVVLPFTSWVVEDTLPAFLRVVEGALDLLSGALDVFMPLGKWLWEEFLQPIASWTGGKIVDLLTSIGEGLTKIGNWVSNHSEILGDLAIIIADIVAAIEAYNIVTGIMTAIKTADLSITGLLAAATDALAVAFTALNWPVLLIVAAIAAVIAIVVLVIKHFGGLEETIAAMKEAWQSLWEKIKEVATNIGDAIGEMVDNIKQFFSDLWETIKNGGRAAINGFLSGVEGFINGIADGLNGLIGLVNDFLGFLGKGVNALADLTGINVQVDWGVPTLGHVSLPRLATGTVVPRQAQQFAAILGDNNRETEVVSPLSTMKEAFIEALNEAGGTGGGTYHFSANINRKTLFEEMITEAKIRQTQTGRNPFEMA